MGARSSAVFALAVVACLLAPAPAGAEEGAAATLEVARQRYLEADFEGARSAFLQLLDTEGLDDATAVEAHRYLAALDLVVDDEASARGHAEAAVALDSEVAAPEGAPAELAALLDEARAAREPEPEPEPARPAPSGPWVSLGLRVGVYVPTVMNQMLPHVTAGLEAALLLPFHDRRLAITLGAAYSPPFRSGEETDPRLGDDGASWTFEMTTHEVFFSLGALYRIFAPGSAVAVPYVGLVARLYLLDTTVTGESQGEEFGENTETSTQVGGAAIAGVEFPLGPGALAVELSFGLSALPHRITGETTTGALALDVGYRLFL